MPCFVNCDAPVLVDPLADLAAVAAVVDLAGGSSESALTLDDDGSDISPLLIVYRATSVQDGRDNGGNKVKRPFSVLRAS